MSKKHKKPFGLIRFGLSQSPMRDPILWLQSNFQSLLVVSKKHTKRLVLNAWNNTWKLSVMALLLSQLNWMLIYLCHNIYSNCIIVMDRSCHQPAQEIITPHFIIKPNHACYLQDLNLCSELRCTLLYLDWQFWTKYWT